ncbi:MULTISPECIES: hypothetical protein [Xanthomonas]|uniref:Uncharacterized protein n=1 Tax=Xanthomonas vesicatoria TaxID=56460 RepID=A0ABS8LFS1_9XANT|nr:MULTISPECIES: hypothetical protein [Xanthomonas]MCC8624612.1 hypothetical protein [Xanthomonas vesicatoria]MCC8695276.1 hypothetical protein [Xanthomonas vesicatoria]MCC8703922.1 hypothetical protein [Xanthomonas vesicatoria]MCD0248283.1 hypothetical protein [Xanthomonas campestris pv. campestris]MCD0260701.1 hypothetical protein [Xanthomonas campestris pv. campestris]
MKLTEKSLKGNVFKQQYALGSKSEQNAVCLQDARGRAYRLRLLDGEPFTDPRLERLVGKTISAFGEIVHGNTMIVKEWKLLNKG